MAFFRSVGVAGVVVLLSLVVGTLRGETPPPVKKDPITSEMRAVLARVNQVHQGLPQKEIDDAIEALHREMARADPGVFVPLAVPHLLRLVPTDTRTRAVLRDALAKGWLEPQLAHAFLVQAGDAPEPHIQALRKDLESKDAKVRARAMSALGACGKAAAAALPQLRKVVENAKADPDDYRRDYTLADLVPEHVHAHWAIQQIEAALKPKR